MSHSPVILDIAGTTLNADDRRRLAHPLVGGMILFARNWADRRALVELTAEIKAIRSDLLICVDHEGGRVQRFRTDGFTHLPAMRVLGELWMKDALGATDAATAAGHVLGAELRACGVDLSFTPVLDLDHGGSGVIGDRAFHRDARVATLLAKSLMHGLLLAGMANCGKHFPGHGFVKADSHTEVPIDKRSLKAILADDAKPYEWLSTSLASVMPAHVIYPKVDAHPAGFSPRWLREILRQQLGFTGAIFSDDLSMEGARRVGGVEVSYADAAAIALSAGCDLVLLCNQSVDGGAAVDELLAGMERGLPAGRAPAFDQSLDGRAATDTLPGAELQALEPSRFSGRLQLASLQSGCKQWRQAVAGDFQRLTRLELGQQLPLSVAAIGCAFQQGAQGPQAQELLQHLAPLRLRLPKQQMRRQRKALAQLVGQQTASTQAPEPIHGLHLARQPGLQCGRHRGLTPQRSGRQLGQQRGPGLGERDALRPPPEQHHPEMLLQELDVAADGTLRDMQLGRRAHEAAVAGGCLEGAQGIERRQRHAVSSDEFLDVPFRPYPTGVC